MKTMTTLNLKNFHRCLTFRHSLCVALLSLSFSVNAESMNRKPAAVEEEVLTVPLQQPDTFSNDVIFAEDDAGVMRDVKASLESWAKTEEYAKTWDLQSTGLYNTPTTLQKKNYINSKILRYADKRLSGEMKKADEGSTLHKVSKVEKQLRPNATINVSKNFGLKFKARVLQGKATVEVQNPWIECNATINATGKAKVFTKKEFKQIGLAGGAEYSVNDSQMMAYLDQKVTENIKARVSSTPPGGVNVFSNNANARLEMTASFPFNY